MSTDDLRERALGLYRPPFRHELVVDEIAVDVPETLQDTVGELVAAALNDFWSRRGK